MGQWERGHRLRLPAVRMKYFWREPEFGYGFLVITTLDQIINQ